MLQDIETSVSNIPFWTSFCWFTKKVIDSLVNLGNKSCLELNFYQDLLEIY